MRKLDGRCASISIPVCRFGAVRVGVVLTCALNANGSLDVFLVLSAKVY
jgi:hypothetical protein